MAVWSAEWAEEHSVSCRQRGMPYDRDLVMEYLQQKKAMNEK